MPAEQRPQARVFGEVADLYDRLRTPYDPLVATVLAALTPGRRAIEIGAGTGHGTAGLVAVGFRVVALEPSAPMAEILRDRFDGRTVEVATTTFESYDAAPADVDLVAAFQSWHWVDATRGWRHAARLLRPGGILGLCWHHPDPLPADVRARLDVHYARHAPDLRAREPGAKGRDVDAPGGPVRTLARAWFDPPVVVEVPWRRTLDADGYVDLLATQSDHRLLPDDRRSALLAALAATVRAGVDPEAGPDRIVLPTTTRLVALRRTTASAPAESDTAGG